MARSNIFGTIFHYLPKYNFNKYRTKQLAQTFSTIFL